MHLTNGIYDSKDENANERGMTEKFILLMIKSFKKRHPWKGGVLGFILRQVVTHGWIFLKLQLITLLQMYVLLSLDH